MIVPVHADRSSTISGRRHRPKKISPASLRRGDIVSIAEISAHPLHVVQIDHTPPAGPVVLVVLHDGTDRQLQILSDVALHLVASSPN